MVLIQCHWRQCHWIQCYCMQCYWIGHQTLTLKVLVTTIDAQWEGMGDVGSARYEPALLPPCPTIKVLRYSNHHNYHIYHDYHISMLLEFIDVSYFLDMDKFPVLHISYWQHWFFFSLIKISASDHDFMCIHRLAGVPGVARVNKKIMIHFVYIPYLLSILICKFRKSMVIHDTEYPKVKS